MLDQLKLPQEFENVIRKAPKVVVANSRMISLLLRLVIQTQPILK